MLRISMITIYYHLSSSEIKTIQGIQCIFEENYIL